jgi:hypothetical protein
LSRGRVGREGRSSSNLREDEPREADFGSSRR